MKITLPEDNEKGKSAPGSNISEDMLEVSEMNRKERKKYLKDQEKNKKKDMTPAEKRQYFFDYYKWKALFVIILIVCLILLGRDLYENSIPYDLSVAVINSTTDMLTYDDFEADYRETVHIDPDHHFRVDSNYVVKYSEDGVDLTGVSSSIATAYERLVSYSRSNYYDALIMDEEGYKYAFHSELIYNLKSFLSEEMLESVKDYIIYDKLEDGTSIPIALDLTKSKKIGLLKLSYENEKVYLAFCCHGDNNLIHIEQLVKYFFL